MQRSIITAPLGILQDFPWALPWTYLIRLELRMFAADCSIIFVVSQRMKQSMPGLSKTAITFNHQLINGKLHLCYKGVRQWSCPTVGRLIIYVWQSMAIPLPKAQHTVVMSRSEPRYPIHVTSFLTVKAFPQGTQCDGIFSTRLDECNNIRKFDSIQYLTDTPTAILCISGP